MLYFSIHRYEHGQFWPNLRESDFDYIGNGNGIGFNINVPLNSIAMKNEDYMAIVHYLLIPLTTEVLRLVALLRNVLTFVYISYLIYQIKNC